MLVRFVALALVGWAVAELALYWLACKNKGLPLDIIHLTLRALPLIVGVVGLLFAKSLAEWISNRLDD